MHEYVQQKRNWLVWTLCNHTCMVGYPSWNPRTQHSCPLVVPFARTNAFQSTFFIDCCSSWNDLPEHVITAPSPLSCKRRLQAYLTWLIICFVPLILFCLLLLLLYWLLLLIAYWCFAMLFAFSCFVYHYCWLVYSLPVLPLLLSVFFSFLLFVFFSFFFVLTLLILFTVFLPGQASH